MIQRAHIRYAGTDTALVVNAGPLPAMKRAFEKAHKACFGFIDRNKQLLVVEAVSVEAIGGGAKFSEKTVRRARRQAALTCQAHALLFRWRAGTRPMSIPRPVEDRRARSEARPSSSSRTRPSSSSPVGRPN